MSHEENRTDITAIILTKNEELNIARCIRSIEGLVDKIYVVDSGSTDQTVEIAKSFGAEVCLHPFVNYAEQFNWALDNLDITSTWIYRIDADEAPTTELKKEILEECKQHTADDVTGLLMKHKLFFLGKFLKHGGAYPFIKMTIFKYGIGRFEERAMGEHVVLSAGRYITLKNDCQHYDCKDLSQFIEKHNGYASREVIDYKARTDIHCEGAQLYKDAARTQVLRDRIYYKLPMFFRAKLYYWYRYYLQLGFLDGKPGKIYALLQAYVYRIMVDAKLYEAEVAESRKAV